MGKTATVWDGEAFREMPEKEATALVKADKAQLVNTGAAMDGNAFKTRAQFQGYKTREMRAERPEPKAEPVAAEKPKPKPKKKAGAKKAAGKKAKAKK